MRARLQRLKEALAPPPKPPIVQLKDALIARDEERALSVYCGTDSKTGGSRFAPLLPCCCSRGTFVGRVLLARGGAT